MNYYERKPTFKKGSDDLGRSNKIFDGTWPVARQREKQINGKNLENTSITFVLI